MVCVFASEACIVSAQVYQVGPSAAFVRSQPLLVVHRSRVRTWGGARISKMRAWVGRRRWPCSGGIEGSALWSMRSEQRNLAPGRSSLQLWFLLGYAARLDGKYQQSVEAYLHGLRLNPSDLDALSGLAQVYNLMGRTDEAERILKQVVASSPDRSGDLTMLGEISMRSKDYAGAIDWLGRAEKVHPDARAELTAGRSATSKTKQMDQAKPLISSLPSIVRQTTPKFERAMAGFYRDTGKPSPRRSSRPAHRFGNPKPDVTAELAYTYQRLMANRQSQRRFFARAANEEPKGLDTPAVGCAG